MTSLYWYCLKRRPVFNKNDVKKKPAKIRLFFETNPMFLLYKSKSKNQFCLNRIYLGSGFYINAEWVVKITKFIRDRLKTD